jgi:hypothetical protein
LGRATLTHAGTPERGFLPHRWQGYNEALLLYVLGLGSDTSASEDKLLGLDENVCLENRALATACAFRRFLPERRERS